MRTAHVAVGWTCGLFCAVCVVAQPPPEADSFEIPRDPTRTIQLENGLRVVVIEDHAEPKVSVQLWYRGGASADPADKPGLTHVVQTVRRLQRAALDAAPLEGEYATLSDACYEIRGGAKSELERILGDVRRKMNHAQLRIDRSLLIREIRRHAWREETTGGGYRLPADGKWDEFRINPSAFRIPQDPSRRATADVALRTALFGSHAYSRPPEAVDLSLRGISDEDIVEHHKRWFVTGAAVLVIYGDIDAETCLEKVRGQFGDLPWAEPPPLDRERPPAAGRAVVRQIDRDTWEVAFRVPPLATPERDALAVLRELLLNPADGLWAREGLISLDEWATTEAAVWRLRIRSRFALGDNGDWRFTPPPALLGPILEHVANRLPDPVRLHRARSLALTRAARDKWWLWDRAALAGAGFALAHGADLNVQPDVAADAVRQVARALAEQLQGQAGPSGVKFAPPRDIGRIDIQRDDLPELSPRSSTALPAYRTQRALALSPYFEPTQAWAGRNLAMDSANVSYPPPAPEWSTLNGGIEFYRHACQSITRIAIGVPVDADRTPQLPAPPPDELDRLTYHGFFFEGYAAEWSPDDADGGGKSVPSPDQHPPPEALPRSGQRRTAYWCGPTDELPRFLDSWRRWRSHDAGDDRGNRRSTLRIYGDDSCVRMLGEWRTQLGGVKSDAVETR